ncbi:MAG: glycosyltransferase family 2 protein [Promethearchaeota archaeon]
MTIFSKYETESMKSFLYEIELEKINLLKVSIVIPCYNEKKTISRVLDHIESMALPFYEIIVVDDGSTDNIMMEIENFKNTKIIVHKKNMGYGKSLIDGVKHCTGDIIVTIDSDGQHVPKDLLRLYKPIVEGKADIVIGSRYLGSYNYNIPFSNRLGEAFIEIMLNIVFRNSIKNNQGGFRVFHRRTLEIFDNVVFFGMAFTTELLMLGLITGYKIKEMPINLRIREVGKSNVKKVRLLMNILRCIGYYGIVFFKNKFKLRDLKIMVPIKNIWKKLLKESSIFV